MKKRKIIIIFIAYLFLINSSQLLPQSNFTQKENTLNIRKHQHTIDAEAFSLGYSYAQELSEKCSMGVGIQMGFGIHLFLNTPKYIEYSPASIWGNTDSITPSRFYEREKKILSGTAEYLRFSLFYRRFLKRNLYADFGGYYSIGILPSIHGQAANDPLNTNIGLSVALFYGYDKLKVGHRIQIGNIHIDYFDNVSTDIKSIVLTPLIIQLSIVNKFSKRSNRLSD